MPVHLQFSSNQPTDIAESFKFKGNLEHGSLFRDPESESESVAGVGRF